jgi:hypothetical protein
MSNLFHINRISNDRACSSSSFTASDIATSQAQLTEYFKAFDAPALESAEKGYKQQLNQLKSDHKDGRPIDIRQRDLLEVTIGAIGVALKAKPAPKAGSAGSGAVGAGPALTINDDPIQKVNEPSKQTAQYDPRVPIAEYDPRVQMRKDRDFYAAKVEELQASRNILVAKHTSIMEDYKNGKSLDSQEEVMLSKGINMINENIEFVKAKVLRYNQKIAEYKAPEVNPPPTMI